MDMAAFLAQFTPEQVTALKAQLDQVTAADPEGRSPFRPRQLDDLRLRPTATDPRPTFFWSTESPRTGDLTKTTPYPRLLWEEATGAEITVYDSGAEADKLAHGYVRLPPAFIEPDPVEQMRTLLEALSPEDRETVLAAQKLERMGRIKQQLSELPADQLAQLLAEHSGEPSTDAAPRRPGRPRKETSAA
jgi:hypothetical protein